MNVLQAEKYRLRAAEPGEAEMLSELAMRSKAHWGYPAALMSAFRGELACTGSQIASDEYSFVVAESGGAVVGYYALLRISATEFELDSLFVEPEFIGRGIGRGLMDHAKRTAAERGALILTIQSDPYAERFYRSAGGVVVGRRESGSIPGRYLPLLTIQLNDRRTNMERETHRLYDDLASWWPLLSPPEDYAEEADFYAKQLKEAAVPEARTVLELGSGGGNNASHMKRHFDLTLVDPSPGMLAQSRLLNPECEHLEGDMRTVRLGRQFDGVFVHDAVCYMTTEADLRRALHTVFAHCRPGGAAVIAPDHVKETYQPSTSHGGSDGDGRALRHLEWSYDPDPTDTLYTVDYAYLLRDADGSVRVEHDRHVEGLFARPVWLEILSEAGFEAEAVPFQHSELSWATDVFVARRPPTKPGAAQSTP